MFTPTTLTLIGVAAAVLAVLAVGGFVYLRRRRPQDKDHVFYFNCPGCGHRLGFRKQQLGHSGPCPRCKRRITLPSVPGK